MCYKLPSGNKPNSTTTSGNKLNSAEPNSKAPNKAKAEMPNSNTTINGTPISTAINSKEPIRIKSKMPYSKALNTKTPNGTKLNRTKAEVFNNNTTIGSTSISTATNSKAPIRTNIKVLNSPAPIGNVSNMPNSKIPIGNRPDSNSLFTFRSTARSVPSAAISSAAIHPSTIRTTSLAANTCTYSRLILPPTIRY